MGGKELRSIKGVMAYTGMVTTNFHKNLPTGYKGLPFLVIINIPIGPSVKCSRYSAE
jgi:hypothetical protein